MAKKLIVVLALLTMINGCLKEEATNVSILPDAVRSPDELVLCLGAAGIPGWAIDNTIDDPDWPES